MRTRNFLLFGILLMMSATTLGQTIEIRVSVKIILDPTTGARPAGITNNLFQTAADRANIWMTTYSRGYRYRIAEVLDIGGPNQGGDTGPSKWFGKDPRGNADWPVFQADTQNDTQYLLRTDHLNFYISFGPVTNTGGACPFPWETGSACWGAINDGPFWLVHESGHFLGLPHTFGGVGGTNESCTEPTVPGDDGFSDTLPEIACWTQNQISLSAYGVTYDSLLPGDPRRTNVDNTFFNTMSYHNALQKDLLQDRLTELQLDREADIANSSRATVVSGKTHFSSISGADTGSGSSTSPYRTVFKAVAVANNAGGDIILLRPGAYNEVLTITKPCTLRATRTGPVSIGSPLTP